MATTSPSPYPAGRRHGDLQLRRRQQCADDHGPQGGGPAPTTTSSGTVWATTRTTRSIARPSAPSTRATPVTLRFRTYANDVTGVRARVWNTTANAQSFLDMQRAATGVSCYEAGAARQAVRLLAGDDHAQRPDHALLPLHRAGRHGDGVLRRRRLPQRRLGRGARQSCATTATPSRSTTRPSSPFRGCRTPSSTRSSRIASATAAPTTTPPATSRATTSFPTGTRSTRSSSRTLGRAARRLPVALYQTPAQPCTEQPRAAATTSAATCAASCSG